MSHSVRTTGWAKRHAKGPFAAVAAFLLAFFLVLVSMHVMPAQGAAQPDDRCDDILPPPSCFEQSTTTPSTEPTTQPSTTAPPATTVPSETTAPTAPQATVEEPVYEEPTTDEATFEESTTTTAESAFLSPLETSIDLLAAGNGSPGSETAQTTEPPSGGSSAPEEDRILWLIVGALVAVAALVALITWRYWLLTRPGLDLGDDDEMDGFDDGPAPSGPPSRSAMPIAAPPSPPGPPGPIGPTVFDDPHATQPYTPPDVFPGPAGPERPLLAEPPSAVPSPQGQSPMGQRVDAPPSDAGDAWGSLPAFPGQSPTPGPPGRPEGPAGQPAPRGGQPQAAGGRRPTGPGGRQAAPGRPGGPAGQPAPRGGQPQAPGGQRPPGPPEGPEGPAGGPPPPPAPRRAPLQGDQPPPPGRGQRSGRRSEGRRGKEEGGGRHGRRSRRDPFWDS